MKQLNRIKVVLVEQNRTSKWLFALIERQGAKKDGGYILIEKGSVFLT